MPVFISYSQKDEAAYSSLCLALEGQGIQYWDSKTMKAGGSLREQLREGIKKCEVCIFLATKHSINSLWCLAELGAFWGAGIAVMVFIADTELAENQIPPQFQGNLWTRDIRQIVRDVKSEISAVDEKKRADVVERATLVSDMTVDMFYHVISSLQSKEVRSLWEIFILLRESFEENAADAKAFAMPLLDGIIGKTKEHIHAVGTRYWLGYFSLTTDTGKWVGFSLGVLESSIGFRFEKCLLTHFNQDKCDAAALVANIFENSEDENIIVKLDKIIANTGTVVIGQLQNLDW